MKKGYLINELTNKHIQTEYAIGIECDYKIKDEKIEFTEEPKIYIRCKGESMGLFLYVKNAEVLHEPGQDLKKFKEHINKLQTDDQYNKDIVKYFTNLAKNNFPEDVYNGLYYEFNEY